MELSIGALLDGKVKSIMNYGAFIQLEGNRTGLVHISEVANGFVNDIHSHLTQGQDVRVKVIGVDEKGRINLSIRQAQEKPRPAPRMEQVKAPLSFEEKLKQFMSDSDSKIAGCRQYEHKTKSRRR
ncbi:MAG: S1 RNA-binding domain-containing protein [Ruminococcaceae bacterium]|nr:S1 RNA-binding domain-containing protein [Oscillospiraceae bacterium]